MVSLSAVHIVYLIMIVGFLITMLFKKSIVVPCAVGIMVIAYMLTGGIVASFQALFNTLVWAGNELFGIITVIALVVAMSKSLTQTGADKLMVRPLQKMVVGQSMGFWVLGIVMFIVSLCIWPSPAVALVGALMLPIAQSTGMPIIWAAVAMNLFGHGMALSGDFFIQGAPTITAKAAGSTPAAAISASLPLWTVMTVTVAVVAFIMFKKDTAKSTAAIHEIQYDELLPKTKKSLFIAILTPLAFLADIIVMLKMNLQGGDATALVGGTAFLILVIADTLDKGPNEAFELVSDHLKEGFAFGIRIFAPVIVIGGFFFLGGEGAAKAVFGMQATGLLSDIGNYLAQNVPLSKFPVVIVEAIVAIVTGLDGSGFSGLPVIGATANTFANALVIKKDTLAAMGQLITIWVGGGTVIPWAVIPVAAICNVNPMDLVRKNLIPVLSGILAVVIATLVLV